MKNKLHDVFSENSHRDKQYNDNVMALQEAKIVIKNKEQEIKDLLVDMRVVKKSEDSLLTIISQIKASNARLEQKMA